MLLLLLIYVLHLRLWREISMNCSIDINGFFLGDAPGIEQSILCAPHTAPDGTKPDGMRKAKWLGTWNTQTESWDGGSWVDEEGAALAAELAEQSFSAMEQRLEAYTQEVARQRRYRLDAIHIWKNSADPVIAAEAAAFTTWYESFWQAAAQVEADVRAGTRTAPSYEELIAELPQMVWP